MNPAVFFTSALLIIGFVVVSMIANKQVGDASTHLLNAITTKAGWIFTLTINVILIFMVYIMFSQYGNIRLGGDDATPEFSTKSWFAMLFSAGIGIGLLFYGVAEPMFHYSAGPFPTENKVEAARTAMDFTFMHWGLHAWAIYALVALALAFFSFNKGQPLSIRSIFYPLLGDKIYGFWGNLIDILATVATMFGVATSLGYGAKQVNAGLNHLFGISQSITVQIILIVIITCLATISVVRGLNSGIRKLSEINIYLAFALLAFVFICGPTLFILNGFGENIGSYIQNFAKISTWNETFERTSWQNSWSVFYWAWWISWSPFVGMFIARVSKGRTIREFLIGVLAVPTLITFLWMTVFGNSALYIEMFVDSNFAQSVMNNVPLSLFLLLEKFPFSTASCLLGVVAIITFFVTSSDSGSMVIDIITSGGNPDPPKPQRLFWATLEGVVAACLLVGGGLPALQSAVVSSGLPFTFVLLLLCFSLKKAFNEYTGVQTFSIKMKNKAKSFTIESGDEAPVVFFKKKEKK